MSNCHYYTRLINSYAQLFSLSDAKKNWCPITCVQPLSAHHKTETFILAAQEDGPAELLPPFCSRYITAPGAEWKSCEPPFSHLPMAVSHSPRESLYCCQPAGRRGKPSRANSSGNTNKPESLMSQKRVKNQQPQKLHQRNVEKRF